MIFNVKVPYTFTNDNVDVLFNILVQDTVTYNCLFIAP